MQEMQCRQHAVADYERGRQLFQKKNYAQVLVLLECAGRMEYPGALYDIGYAYWAVWGVPARTDYTKRFFQEAGFQANVYSALLFQWKMYARYHGMDGCENI